MRAHGLVEAIPSFGASDHICWNYASDPELGDAVVRWVSDGLENGHRVMYVTDRTEQSMLAELAPLGAIVRSARERGALVLGSVRDVYRGAPPVDPDEQLRVFADATSQAIADGYSGLRAVADVTRLFVDAAWRKQHTRWEQLVDRYTVDNPLSFLCAYDRRVLGPSGAAGISCVHPLRHEHPGGGATFSVFAATGGLWLEGEIDTFQAGLLDVALETRPDRDALVLYVSPNAFLDAAATGVIAKHAKELGSRGIETVIDGANPTLRRVWKLLGFAELDTVRFT